MIMNSRNKPQPRAVRPGTFTYSVYHSDRHPQHVANRPPASPPKPAGARKHFTGLKILVAIIVLVAGAFWWHQHDSSSNGQGASANKTTQSQLTYSVSQASSLWVVVNKARPLNPVDYAPANLVTPHVPLRLDGSEEEMHVRSDTAKAMQTMFAAASAQGVQLMLSSGYRSYPVQVGLYNYYVSVQGQNLADAQSAKPGYSEHQTGLAADIVGANGGCNAQQCFGNMPEGRWLAANAYKYGFIIRYPQGKTSITGYEYEPWHIRYIGTDLSTKMHDQGIQTLEEYFHLPAAPDYTG
jgi:D-alanyl-D-alanine carboxypeptidase